MTYSEQMLDQLQAGQLEAAQSSFRQALAKTMMSCSSVWGRSFTASASFSRPSGCT